MPEVIDERVVRYCPECGKRFVAHPQQFAEPRICPSSKTRVVFRDYSREPLPEIAAADEIAKKRDPKIHQRLATILAATVCSILVFCFIALVTGNITVFFILGCVVLVLGVVGVSLYLDYSSKTNALGVGFLEVQRRLEFQEKNQGTLLNQAHGFKTNFNSLVQNELTSLRKQHEGILSEASADRQTALQELLTARLTIAAEMADAKTIVSRYDAAASAISDRLLQEVRKSIKFKLTPNNFATSKERFQKTVDFCAKKGYAVDQTSVEAFYAELRQDYEAAVRAQAIKEEQARIKAKIREEQQAERELEQEMKRIAAERLAIENALAQALARTSDEHSAEVDELKRRLAEAELKAARAISMAQMTKAGNVYVISNIGSFGDSVFKIGMTRRLEPLDRVKELGDASVPFPFDVHMMISSDNAPSLEAMLHRKFNHRRVNRVNLRKEFFRVGVEEIVAAVEELHGTVDYVASPEAIEYFESQKMSDEDLDFIASQIDPESLPED